MNRLTSTLLLLSLTGAQALAENRSPQNGHSPGGTNAEITHKCQGVERTAQRGWLLYDSNPEPWCFFPLVLSEVHVIGAMSAGQQFTIWRRVDRSTWRRRYAWLEVHVHDNRGDDEKFSVGWITMPRANANTWVMEP